MQERLAELGKYVLEPITVEPFIKEVDDTEFGWEVGQYDDGTHYINIEPGNFICYYAPWDGEDYDTSGHPVISGSGVLGQRTGARRTSYGSQSRSQNDFSPCSLM